MAPNRNALMGYAVVAFGLVVLIPQMVPNEVPNSRAPAPLLEKQFVDRMQSTVAVVDIVPVPSTMDGVTQPRRKAFAALAVKITESEDTTPAPTPAPPTAAPTEAACSP